MNKYLYRLLTAVGIALIVSSIAYGQIPPGAGNRLLTNASALVLFAELGNIGAQDPECDGTKFPVTDIDSLVESAIVPVIEATSKFEGWSNASKRAEFATLFKQMPNRDEGTVDSMQRAYEREKERVQEAYGETDACSALSSIVQTVMQQKRRELFNVMTQLEMANPE